MKARSGALAAVALGATALLLAAGCTPTVAVQAPKEPIVINMNVKIEHEIRVKVDKELEELRETRDDIF